MKLSTARRLVCMSYFTVDGLRPLLATATRIVCSGNTKRFLFPDGSVIESTKGHWKVVDMEKNTKLEAAVRRFGKSGGYTGTPKDEVEGVVAPGAYTFKGTDAERRAWVDSGTNLNFEAWSQRQVICEHFKVPKRIYEFDAKLPTDERCHLLASIAALHKLCNEKDEQLDKANEAVMVVRLDWWLISLVALVLVAHYGFGVL